MATSKPRGMTSSPLARRSATAGGPSLISTLQSTTATTDLELDDLAANPENPPERVADVSDLIGSIADVGVIQPITVIPAESVLAVRPDFADAIGKRPWFVIAGHRRVEASRRAGKTTIAGHIRRDMVDELVDFAMLHENIHRLDITPLDEARAYQRAIDRRGLSQRKLAEHTSVPQSQISKRLSLLTLPEQLQDLIAAGDLNLSDALTITGEDEAVRTRLGETLTPDAARNGIAIELRRARTHVAQAERTQVAQQRAEAEGVTWVENPAEEWGHDRAERRLSSKADIKKAKTDGALVIGPAEHGDDPEAVRYYRGGDLDASTPTKPVNDHEAAERAEQRERGAARKARIAHLVTMATTPPAAAKQMTVIVTSVIHHLNVDAAVGKIASALTHEAGLTTSDPGDVWPWKAEVPALDGKKAQHAAWLIALAAEEEVTGRPHSAWGTRQVAYLELLRDSGYVPTQWETERLSNATTTND